MPYINYDIFSLDMNLIPIAKRVVEVECPLVLSYIVGNNVVLNGVENTGYHVHLGLKKNITELSYYHYRACYRVNSNSN